MSSPRPAGPRGGFLKAPKNLGQSQDGVPLHAQLALGRHRIARRKGSKVGGGPRDTAHRLTACPQGDSGGYSHLSPVSRGRGL